MTSIRTPVMCPQQNDLPLDVPEDSSMALIQSGRALSMDIPDDSSAPRILTGDIALIDTVFGDKLKDDTLYVLKFGDIYAVRRTAYQRNGDLKLTCGNPEFRHTEQTIAKSDIDSLDVLGECNFFYVR